MKKAHSCIPCGRSVNGKCRREFGVSPRWCDCAVTVRCQAKGIIMGDRHCSADEAFAILSKLSQDTNPKVRDVAAMLVDEAKRRHP
jgi:hypothetical protein